MNPSARPGVCSRPPASAAPEHLASRPTLIRDATTRDSGGGRKVPGGVQPRAAGSQNPLGTALRVPTDLTGMARGNMTWGRTAGPQPVQQPRASPGTRIDCIAGLRRRETRKGLVPYRPLVEAALNAFAEPRRAVWDSVGGPLRATPRPALRNTWRLDRGAVDGRRQRTPSLPYAGSCFCPRSAAS